MMEDGQTHPSVCRSMNLPPLTVGTLMKNADKIIQSMQLQEKVGYSSSKFLEKNGEIIVIIMGGFLQSTVLTQAVITDKAKSTVEDLKIKKKRALMKHFLLSRSGSRNLSLQVNATV
jgi:hypothetical protein